MLSAGSKVIVEADERFVLQSDKKGSTKVIDIRDGNNNGNQTPVKALKTRKWTRENHDATDEASTPCKKGRKTAAPHDVDEVIEQETREDIGATEDRENAI